MKRPIRGLYQNKLKKLIYKNFNRFCPCSKSITYVGLLVVFQVVALPGATFHAVRWCVSIRTADSRPFANWSHKTTVKQSVSVVIKRASRSKEGGFSPVAQAPSWSGVGNHRAGISHLELFALYVSVKLTRYQMEGKVRFKVAQQSICWADCSLRASFGGAIIILRLMNCLENGRPGVYNKSTFRIVGRGRSTC